MASPFVFPIDRLALRYDPQAWRFATKNRPAIDAHFAAARQQRPQLWNGRVLVMHDHRIERGRLHGAFLDTDFASFLAWRDWGFPDAGVLNCFSMGALRSCDGVWIMGVMATHTANAGGVYFPAGTPDPTDIVDGVVDLAGSVVREVAEETGLTEIDYTAEAGWLGVLDGARLALMKVLNAREPVSRLSGRIRDFIAGQSSPELADVHTVRGTADFDPMMPRFVTAFVDHMGK